MQTIITSINRLSNTKNLVFIVTNINQLPEKYLSTEEYLYVRKAHKNYKKDIFAFNHFKRWVFVLFVKKERNKALRSEHFRETGAKFLKLANDNKLHAVTIVDVDEKSKDSLAFSEGMALANYQFLKYKKDSADKLNTLNTIELFSKGIDANEIDELNIVIDGACKCRDLVNEPLIYLNAEKFAKAIELLGKKSGAKVEIFNKKKIESLKMGGLLAVNRGSIDPPTFTIMEWRPKDPVNDKPYIFVGKGVVYDTGGMNVKTADYMNNMKCDMAGGAAVVSALYSIARLALPVHVIALVPATDNRVDGNAYVNGDIITMHDGTNVEVINTDAEGRMILADALSYAKKYNPRLVINVATLTGSASRAIGKYGIVGMHSKAENEFKNLKKSGDSVCERLVEFPLWKDYEELIKSDIGDIKNLGGVDGGAITAGKFLQHFTGYPFIHLDIAGPAFNEKPFKYFTSGGSGIAVRLLFDFIKRKAFR